MIFGSQGFCLRRFHTKLCVRFQFEKQRKTNKGAWDVQLVSAANVIHSSIQIIVMLFYSAVMTGWQCQCVVYSRACFHFSVFKSEKIILSLRNHNSNVTGFPLSLRQYHGRRPKLYRKFDT